MAKHPPFNGWSDPSSLDVRTDRVPLSEVEASRADFEGGYEVHTTKTPRPDFKAGSGLNDLVLDSIASRVDPC